LVAAKVLKKFLFRTAHARASKFPHNAPGGSAHAGDDRTYRGTQCGPLGSTRQSIPNATFARAVAMYAAGSSAGPGTRQHLHND
jgi:hypothetical protein